MTIKEVVTRAAGLPYKELCSALIERFGVKQTVKWDSVLPHAEQQTLFGGEVLRLISDHPTLANQKEIRPVCLIKGELSQLLFFYVQLKDEKLPKAAIERIARKFVGGAAADRYIIWFFGNKTADVLKIVISGKEGKKIRLKTLALEAGQWFKTYDYILSEVERKFNTGGLFQQFKEPSGLWKAVWEAFDISIVNKKFYAEIKGIFDALTKEELPKCKGILTNEQDRVQFAIRLIGRIIFCWFLKRKGIIANDVLSSHAVESHQNYYRNILELLFFDVFNTAPNERRKDLPDSIKNYPFLNGGLFEPQHQDHKGNWALNISNSWFINFFNNTLERYNFTVDENSSASSEIAIDPEMLGRIFENLLAEHNPETGESARKATGSYYTPREIVDFMVEESLIAYLKTGLADMSLRDKDESISKDEIPRFARNDKVAGLLNDAIEDFVHTGTFPDALKPHSKELLDKLNAIKVLDPACGSGAFPISMLQKLAGLKLQLDPKTTPYDLKLKTIENSIYGVDIQPMATELSRLRCWLSLIVDEDPKDIKPLPNLDFKFVTANSLIDLGYDEFILKVETGKTPALFLHDFKNKLDALKGVRQKYFEPSLHQREKDKLKKEFTTIKDDLFKMSLELIKQKLLDAEFANKVIGWDPFDDSKPAPFFNKNWMFGVEDGFDVVIANPPYINIEQLDEDLKKYIFKNCKTCRGRTDIYIAFIESFLNTLKENGSLCFIIPYAFTNQKYGAVLRKLLIDKYFIKEIIDTSDYFVFDAAIVKNIILLATKTTNQNKTLIKRVSSPNDFIGNNIKTISINQTTFLKLKDYRFETQDISSSLKLKENILSVCIPFEKICFIAYGARLNHKTKNIGKEHYIKYEYKEGLKTFLEGKNIQRYYFTQEGWLDYKPEEHYNPMFKELFENEKIMFINVVKDRLRFAYDNSHFYNSHTVINCVRWELLFNVKHISVKRNINKDKIETGKIYDDRFLLGVLNSSLINWYFLNFLTEKMHFYPDDAKSLPIVKISNASQQEPIVALVTQILTVTKDPNYSGNPDKQAKVSALEREIDKMVYAIYGLTPEEIAIVEGKG